ncbi:MAG: glutaminyl-peptide cyclotransferase [bacterium]|nr:glutaminyl-peptide cyclotransferase [bacterium]
MIQISTYQIVNTFPHNPKNFTQGLVYENGFIYEGTGRNGTSSLQQVDLATGNARKTLDLSAQYFGEGIAVYQDKIFQLTWESHVGFIYDKESFAKIGDFTYSTEGWGLTFDGEHLIMSDGTSTLHLLDPGTLTETGTILVTDNSGPIDNLNELEFIRGEIFANIWPTDKIVRIDPQTGQVKGWVDLDGILSPEATTRPVDCLNGIAYDSENDRLFVTGKYWPSLFEIKLVPAVP